MTIALGNNPVQEVQQNPSYRLTYTKNGKEMVREYAKNGENISQIAVLDKINGKVKGATDHFALIARSSKLVTPYMPPNISSWTEHVGNFFVKARSALSLPYMFCVIHKCKKDLKPRNVLELASTSLNAASLFITSALSKTFSSLGAMFKAAVESVDTYDNTKKYFETKELISLADKSNNFSETVKKGLCTESTELIFKVFRYALATIAGIAATFCWLSGMTLPLALATAILAGSIGSAALGFAADYVHETRAVAPVFK